MSHRLRLLTSLAAALAVTGCTAAVASAAPPELVNKEGTAAVKSHFTISRVNGWQFDLPNWGAFSCERRSGSGTITGLKTLTAKLTLTGCAVDGFKFKTHGAKEGEIVIPEVTERVVLWAKTTTPILLLTLPTELVIENGSLEKLKMHGDFLVERILDWKSLATYDELQLRQSQGYQSPREYQEAEGGEVKTAKLLTSAEGLHNFTNERTGIEGAEQMNFEEELKFVG